MLEDKSIVRSPQPAMPARIKQKLRAKLSKGQRKKRNEEYRAAVEKKDFSVIASFCGGGTLYHDLGMRFLSPTVNLAFDGEDFCKFCLNLEHYISQELVEHRTELVSHPVGMLDDVQILFVHYKTFAEAKEKWEERSKRINFDRIFVMATDRDGMTNCMEQFDRIPYKKVMYTAKPYPQYDWAVYCPCFKKRSAVGVMTGICDLKGHRFYEKYVDMPGLINACGRGEA